VLAPVNLHRQAAVPLQYRERERTKRKSNEGAEIVDSVGIFNSVALR